jgi:kynureninase
MTAPLTRAQAEALDAADPLRAKRDEFVLPDGLIYLDGNSLGPASKAALRELKAATDEEWTQGLIRSWNTAHWFSLPERLGDRIARLVGAKAGEIVVTDSTSINIFKALSAAMALRPDRKTIVAEAGSFPTDLYIVEGFATTEARTEIKLEGVEADTIESLIDRDTAVVLVNQVDYRSGRLRDMKALTERIHAAGAIAVWDLCHSAGAMPVELGAAKADLAVGCTYKYLNGGPGAPAFIYVARQHHGKIRQPLSGWWGHAAPFAFERTYRPEPNARQMLCGTQPILSMRALDGALDVFDHLDLHALRGKSVALTSAFIDLVEARCGRYGVLLASPREDGLRGSQVSLTHPEAYALCQALIERGVIGDFRAPDFLRFGFAPLYIRFADVWNAVDSLTDLLESGAWRAERFAKRAAVT